jgi:hypothetical protein
MNSNSTAQIPHAPRRLTMRQVMEQHGPIGRLLADSSFPKMSRGTFDEAAVIAWVESRDSQKFTPATQTVVSTNTPRDRRSAAADRRTPRV